MRLTSILAMSLLSLFSFSQAKPLDIGSTVPEVEAIDQDGKPFPLNETLRTGTTLVFFYPKANTPGCTAQACSLRDQYQTLLHLNLKIIGVSCDSPQSQKKFKTQHNLPFPLLADEKGQITKAFGVPTTLGFAARQSFLIRNGKVVWRDLHPQTSRHAQDVLQALETLGK
ncbi:MAG: peroxiredoxin [Methylacidiphilales bacterium]|nr:peroxiredoxin [Candidatus Methylacidiphilales bacterium]MDW8349487.1 peroxiredoxin [Verrucomicrobiae bacterium]